MKEKRTVGTQNLPPVQKCLFTLPASYGGEAARQAGHRAAGHRAIVLRPGLSPDRGRCVVVGDGIAAGYPNLRYAMPAELRESLLKFINKSIHPFVRDRGLDWEIHIDDTPRDQWTIQGMRPPDSGSEEEKRWIRENRPSKPPQSVASKT